MFNIDDELLKKIGYNVATLTEEQKDKYKEELTEGVNQRAAELIVPHLSEEQIEEFSDVQGNPDRTRRWLAEFHGDFASREDYQQVRQMSDSDEEAMSFYASALWLRYAVPNYGELMQQALDEYADELIDMRNQVNAELGIAG